MATSAEIDEYYNVAVKLAQTAGEVIRKAIDETKNVETKESNVDLVTETDKKVEEILRDGFASSFPNHCFIGEESERGKLTDAPTWIIDPVDGTMNFVHRFPYNAVSIGLAVNKQIVLGVIYNPVLDRMYTGIKGKGAFLNGKKLQVSKVQEFYELAHVSIFARMYTGIKGKGAFLNGKKLQVSKVQELSQALVITEFGSTRTKENLDQLFTNVKLIVDKAHGIRMMGSAALNMCAVAAGEADAYFEYSIHCWDMAAGRIIVEEAGGTVIDPEGGAHDIMSRRVLCTSSSALAKTLSKELKHIQFPRDE